MGKPNDNQNALLLLSGNWWAIPAPKSSKARTGSTLSDEQFQSKQIRAYSRRFLTLSLLRSKYRRLVGMNFLTWLCSLLSKKEPGKRKCSRSLLTRRWLAGELVGVTHLLLFFLMGPYSSRHSFLLSFLDYTSIQDGWRERYWTVNSVFQDHANSRLLINKSE